MTFMTDASSTGPSEWERDLYARLSGHVESERGLLEEYSTAAETSPSKALRYLVTLLVEDEVRHHRLFNQIVESLRTEALLSGEDPPIPYLDFDEAANYDAVIELTGRLLRREQEDSKELKRLQHELRDVEDTTLWTLLVELMEQDTKKHMTILRFARKHAGRRKR
jgi:rubrerythrin